MQARIDRIKDISKKVSEWKEGCSRDADPQMELMDLARRLELTAEEIRSEVRGYSLLHQ